MRVVTALLVAPGTGSTFVSWVSDDELLISNVTIDLLGLSFVASHTFRSVQTRPSLLSTLNITRDAHRF